MRSPEASQEQSIVGPLLMDAVTAVYGAWTIASTITSLGRWTPRIGLNAGAGLLVLIGAGLVVAALRRPAWLAAYLTDLRHREAPAAATMRGSARVLLVAAIVAVSVLWFWTRNAVAVWGAIVLFYLFCSYKGMRQSPVEQAEDARPAQSPAWQNRAVHGLAIVCALFTLFAFRPRSDDAFYVSMSVGVVNHPDAPLLGEKTIHGPPVDGLPPQPMFVPYRAQSYETLGGYLAYLTGVPAIDVVHLGLATFFGWCAPYAIARVLQLVAGRSWFFALITTLSYYFIEGTAGRGYANQAFVRLFHGKAVLLTVGVPMVLAYGLRFGMRRSRSRFALLALAQIAAMGMSSTGIWLAPMLAMLAVVSATPRLRNLPGAVGLSVLSSGYVLAVGLIIRAQLTVDTRLVRGLAPNTALAASDAFRKTAYLLPEMLGQQPTAIALLCTAALACALAEQAVAVRLFAFTGLCLFGFLANPWLLQQVSGSITGALTYERVFWILPVPIALGVAVVGLVAWIRPRLGRNAAILWAVAALLVFYSVATQRLVISDANQSRLRYPPVVKAWPRAQRVARALCELAPFDTAVLAPEGISRQLATLERCGHPLIAGMRWMTAPIAEERRRILLGRALCEDGRIEPDRSAKFQADLDYYHIAAAAMSPLAVRSRAAKTMLRAAGFKKVRVVAGYHLWARDGGARVHQP